MGCGPSRESVIKELESIMLKLKQENQELEETRNNLKLQQELTSNAAVAVPSLSELVSNSVTLEGLLQEAKRYGVSFLPPNTPDLHQNTVIVGTISLQNELEEKNERIYQLKAEIYRIYNDYDLIKKQISDIENQIQVYSHSLEFSGDLNAEMKHFLNKMNQLEDTKQDLINQVTSLEQDCKDLSDQIIALETQENLEKDSGMTFENLLTMSEEEIRRESSKLDTEIKELLENIKKLKEKELEIEELSNYVLGLKISNSPKTQTLKQEARETGNRIKSLEKEKERLLLEIQAISKGFKKLQSEKRSPFQEADYDRKFTIDSDENQAKAAFDQEIEQVIRKAREVAVSSLNPRNTL
jgi:chromosome segregation ATPase